MRTAQREEQRGASAVGLSQCGSSSGSRLARAPTRYTRVYVKRDERCRAVPADPRGSGQVSLPRAQLLRRAANGVAAGIVLLLAAGSARAAERQQLAPIDRNFGFHAPYAQMHAYHVAVRDALLGAKTHRSCEAIVIPSFQNEWSIHLQPDASGSGREVVHTVMQRQLWGEMQIAADSIRPRDEVAALARIPKPTLRFSAPLSATSATALDRLWEAMLARVEQPAEPVRCIDGTSY